MSKGYSDVLQFSSFQQGENFGCEQDEFNRLSQVVGTNIQKITQNVSSVQKMVNQLGTTLDSESLHSQLHQIQNYTNQLAKDTHQHLRKLISLDKSSSQHDQRQNTFLKEKLTNNFTEALKNFQAVQRLAAQKEKASVMRARLYSGLQGDPNADESPDIGTALIDLASPTHSQTALQIEDEVDLELLREREQSIKKLESDIVDVNQIFKDLASMVYEQGEIIDSIEANVESSAIHVEQGTQQLVKARHHQAKVRRKKCFLVVFGIIVLVVVMVIIVIATKSDGT
ncbi:syntaxin-12-like isoform X2 [Limulus polyphemus]|uniref:Syntaxin-12-like isoform X2 n=1 Tax=Limulus polyphemus TaxID=6850 RepID=A0ABM1SB88_LIMPO|nr:syntaxin-12-like isoform X2 [Limulus polyphemus]XP_022240894.1 syntaxin-12-like isoform X2 [Limulus polyphemus]